MIELALELPLAGYALRVETRLTSPFTALMGASGAGKTSLLESVAGLRAGARGRIVIDDDVVLDTARGVRVAPERRRIGYVPQDAALFPHLTVGANVGFGARGDTAAAERALATLEIAALTARYPASLSGGERQRVALARALATRPRLLLLDEPLAAVDVELRERVLPYLLRLRDEGVRALYVTHNLGEALAIADDAIVLDHGAVATHGPPALLVGTPELAAAAGGLENVRRGRVDVHHPAGGVTMVVLDGGAPAIRLAVPLLGDRRAGEAVTCVIRAEDILVSVTPIAGLSARNVLAARVCDVVRGATDVILRCDAGDAVRPWLVRLTAAAFDSLALAEGAVVWLAMKSHSIRVV